MDIKLLQLNIYQGKQYEILKKYLREEDFDILSLQEIAGHNKAFVDLDIFEDLKKELNLKGEMVKTTNFPGDKESYAGNAILYKESLKTSNKAIVWMKPFEEILQENHDWSIQPRAALSLDFEISGKTITIVDAHMAWGENPYDKDYKSTQAKILLDYLGKLSSPFILTGDFNLVKETQIIRSFAQIARDLVSEKGITNTLNSNVHRIKELFPRGLAVDYVFTSSGVYEKTGTPIRAPQTIATPLA